MNVRSVFGSSTAKRMASGVRDKIRKIQSFARNKQNDQAELERSAKRGEALDEMQNTQGWAVVLERINARKEDIFRTWMSEKAENVNELKAAVRELETLTSWLAAEIGAGKDSGQRLEMLVRTE